jgi:adenosylcobinamide-GDP ribazoletransferase
MAAAVLGAFGFLTILPTGGVFPPQPGRVFAWFPLVGAVIGGAVYAAARLPTPLAPFLALTVWVVLTGGLHLDGFADACDGLLAVTTPERRLTIMRDPQAGSWAVVGLVLLLLGNYAALAALPDPRPLLLIPVLGRWVMVIAVAVFPYARSDGLGGAYREGLGPPQVTVATLLTLAAVGGMALWVGWSVGVLLLPALLTLAIGGGWAARQLGGGLTGDVYGGLCEVMQLAALITASILYA